MSGPPVKIEAEFLVPLFTFGESTWGGTGGFADLTSRAFSFTVQRGRQDYTQPFQAGTCTVLFRNVDGELDPEDSGLYFGEIRVGKRLRITSNPNSMLYSQQVFLGFITDIQLSYDLNGDATVAMTAVDGLGLLAQQEIADGTSFPEQSTSDRFLATIALPEVDYPFAVNASTGLSTCAAGTASGNVLTYLSQIATTEQGAIFAIKNGTLVFRNRYELLDAPTLTFTDDGGGTNYESIERLVTQLELYNRLSANRSGEDPVIRDSSTSKDLFGVRFLNLGEVLFGSDAEVTDMIDFAMVRFSSTSPRVTEVTTLLDDKSQIVVGQLMLLDLTVSVTVEFTPPGVSQIVVPCSIESIAHAYTVGQGWRVTFGFTPRDTSNYLRLDDATLGRLDFNVLGF
jgi:hypothetical protein